MEKVNDYKKRFTSLLESEIGDVKPLISEELEDEYGEELEYTNEDDIRVPGTKLSLTNLRDLYGETIKYYTLSKDGSKVIEINGIPIEEIVDEIFG